MNRTCTHSSNACASSASAERRPSTDLLTLFGVLGAVVEPTPCKPLLLDLAFNAVEYPDISARAKKKGGGWLGGWLGRR